MLSCAMLCCALVYSSVLCCAVMSCTALCCGMLCCAVSCFAVLCTFKTSPSGESKSWPVLTQLVLYGNILDGLLAEC